MAKFNGLNILANCIFCDDALSNFEPVHEYSEKMEDVEFRDKDGYTRISKELRFALFKCSGCDCGALAKYILDVNGRRHLRDFYPEASVRLFLPNSTPKDIVSEFRTAEKCAGIDEYRPAGAMLRSTLEKVLGDHGYTERYLSKNIENAAKEGVLTIPLKKRASEVVKALGDEILHQAWKEITPTQYENSHEYTQRVIENFYDEPETVREILIEKKRIKDKSKEETPE